MQNSYSKFNYIFLVKILFTCYYSNYFKNLDFKTALEVDPRAIRNLETYTNFPADIYLFKVNNKNTRKRCEICSKLKT